MNFRAAVVASFFFLVALGTLYFVFDEEPAGRSYAQISRAPSDLELISHAGAGLPQGDYSNSLQALNRAARSGLTEIEVDFSWTSDNEIVLLHDWNRELNRWFELPFITKVERRLTGRLPDISLADFQSWEMRHDLTQLDLDGLAQWLRSHPDIRIITDFKSENTNGLSQIAERFPELTEQFIPQIYSVHEYDAVRSLGFADIIFTAYRSDLPDADIVAFSMTHKLAAVTVPQSRLTPEALQIYRAMETPLYTHTINDPFVAGWLKEVGIDGVYTDALVPWEIDADRVASLE